MPQDKPPLSAGRDRADHAAGSPRGPSTTRRQTARARYDMDHPPEYTRLPVIPALAFSPDGSLLAVAGFHEVLLWKADGSELVGRLVGLSERIESLAFSPDGKQLAVTGGRPARMGEVQVWDVAKRKLAALGRRSPIDTVYGASWSPDGTKIAFGCADNTVRAIDAKTGEQVLFMGSHSDWALDTVFSVDGSHLISVGRDMTAKLTEVATQRFVDNITSITPGALKGGLAAVARHPKRDEIVVGGSDGEPKLYRVFRQTVRVIGDDSNLIREFPPLPGRVYSVAVSADGKRIAAGSSLDGTGEVGVYGYEFDTGYPDQHQGDQRRRSSPPGRPRKPPSWRSTTRRASSRSPASRCRRAAIYAVAFRPDGKVLAAAGADGIVRLHQPRDRLVDQGVRPGDGQDRLGRPERAGHRRRRPSRRRPSRPRSCPRARAWRRSRSCPRRSASTNRFAYVQLLVTGRLASGETIDVTRMVEPSLSAPIAEVSRSGLVRPRADGKATLTLRLAGKSVEVPVTVLGVNTPCQGRLRPRRRAGALAAGLQRRDLPRLGPGQERLQALAPRLRPDLRRPRPDRRPRRAAGQPGLARRQPDAAQAHRRRARTSAARLMQPGEPYYEILRSWIADGAKLDLTTPRGDQDRGLPGQPGRPADRRPAADPGAGDLRRRRGPRRDPRGVPRKRQHRGRHGRQRRADDRRPPRRGAGPGPVRRELRRDDADRHGRPHRLRLDRAAGLRQDRRAGRRQVAADEDPALGPLHRRRVPPPRLPRPDRPAPDGRRRPQVPGRHARQPRQARRAGRPPDRQPRVRRVLDQQVGRPAPGQPQVPGRRGVGGLPQLDPRPGRRQHAVRQVRPRDPDGQRLEPREPGRRRTSRSSASPRRRWRTRRSCSWRVRFNCNKCHDHPFERWTQDQYYQTAAYFAQVGPQGRPGQQGPDDRRHGRRGGQAALRDRLRHEQGRGRSTTGPRR